MRKLIFVFTILLCTNNAHAQNPEGLSVLDMFDQFVISKGAALACLEPDKTLDANYDANFGIVYKKAWLRLRELKKSDVTGDQIIQTLDARIDSLRANVATDAQNEGCDTKAYKELINLYKYHAIWNPFPSGS